MSFWKSRTQTQHDTQSFHKKPLHFDLRPSTQTTLISELPPQKWCFPTQVHLKHNHMTQLFPLKSSHINHVLLLQFADKLSNGCRDKCRVVAFPHKNRSYCPVWALFCPWVALKKILSFTVVACQIVPNYPCATKISLSKYIVYVYILYMSINAVYLYLKICSIIRNIHQPIHRCISTKYCGYDKTKMQSVDYIKEAGNIFSLL